MFSCYDPQFYHTSPVKSEKLSDEAVGPLDIVSLTKGQFRYAYFDDGIGRRCKKKDNN